MEIAWVCRWSRDCKLEFDVVHHDRWLIFSKEVTNFFLILFYHLCFIITIAILFIHFHIFLLPVEPYTNYGNIEAISHTEL